MRFAGIIRFVAAFAYMVLALIVLSDLSGKFWGPTHISIRAPLFISPAATYASRLERNIVWGCWGGSFVALAAALAIVASGATGDIALFSEAALVGIAAIGLIAAVTIHALRHWRKGVTPQEQEAQNVADEFR